MLIKMFSSYSLASMCFGATAVYPCRGFDPHLTLKAIHEEKYVLQYSDPFLEKKSLSRINFFNINCSIYVFVSHNYPMNLTKKCFVNSILH